MAFATRIRCLAAIAAALPLMLALHGCGGGTTTPAPPPTPKNIVELAQATPTLSTLVQALVAANLVGMLSGPGPLNEGFTLFAPTNAAFEKLPAGTLAGLLKPENIKELTALLEHHVVPGSVLFSDLKNGESIRTLEGAKLRVTIAVGKVLINNATVTPAKNFALNGVVHIIDGVLIPPPGPAPPQNIWQLVQATPSLSTLVTALAASGPAQVLSSPGPYTLFAPTNAAFGKLPKGTLANLLKNVEQLNYLIEYHIVQGKVLTSALTNGESVPTLERASKLKVTIAGGKVMIDNATVTTANVNASNGVVQIIDRVLMPADEVLTLPPALEGIIVA